MTEVLWFIIGGLFLLLFIIVAAIVALYQVKGRERTSARERAGAEGEETATELIRTVLSKEDYLITNIELDVDGKQAELDRVIVNKNGVFVFEVKNYRGTLYGEEEDYEWEKQKTTAAGKTYVKWVKNPVKQVKREVYVLKEYLKAKGISVWVDGYVLLVDGNSEVNSDSLVFNGKELDQIIHTKGKNELSESEVKRIVGLLI